MIENLVRQDESCRNIPGNNSDLSYPVKSIYRPISIYKRLVHASIGPFAVQSMMTTHSMQWSYMGTVDRGVQEHLHRKLAWLIESRKHQM